MKCQWKTQKKGDNDISDSQLSWNNCSSLSKWKHFKLFLDEFILDHLKEKSLRFWLEDTYLQNADGIKKINIFHLKWVYSNKVSSW